MLPGMRNRLASRRLYLAHLAGRQHQMESGQVPMQALSYRVLSKCLREALAGLPEQSALADMPELPAHLIPTVASMLETRHFDNHGELLGVWAAHSREEAAALLGRLLCPPTR
jgi:hypothetical protein